MTTEQINQQSQDIMERGKSLVAEGNKRTVVLHKVDGTEIFQTSLTTAVGVGLLALVTGFLTFPVIVIAGIALYMTKSRLSLHQSE